MKIFNILFCVIFAIFAGLQYNDPDPYVWIPIYLYASVLCWLAANNKLYPIAYWLGIILYALYAAYEFFENNGVLDWIQEHNAQNIAESMKAEKPWIEATREFFGLIILITVMLINYFYWKRRSIKNTPRAEQ